MPSRARAALDRQTSASLALPRVLSAPCWSVRKRKTNRQPSLQLEELLAAVLAAASADDDAEPGPGHLQTRQPDDVSGLDPPGDLPSSGDAAAPEPRPKPRPRRRRTTSASIRPGRFRTASSAPPNAGCAASALRYRDGGRPRRPGRARSDAARVPAWGLPVMLGASDRAHNSCPGHPDDVPAPEANSAAGTGQGRYAVPRGVDLRWLNPWSKSGAVMVVQLS